MPCVLSVCFCSFFVYVFIADMDKIFRQLLRIIYLLHNKGCSESLLTMLFLAINRYSGRFIHDFFRYTHMNLFQWDFSDMCVYSIRASTTSCFQSAGRFSIRCLPGFWQSWSTRLILWTASALTSTTSSRFSAYSIASKPAIRSQYRSKALKIHFS